MEKDLVELAKAIRESRSLPKDDLGMMLLATEVVDAITDYVSKTKGMSFEETTEFYAETGIDDEEVE